MKYEYMLQTWGGFFNDWHKAVHGIEPGYFWFETREARDKYIAYLREIEERLGAHSLATSTEEGENTRYHTIARMVFVYQGVEYPFEYDYGFAYPPESARYMFFDGNYSCDCARSRFIQGKNDDFPDLECGDEVEMKNFEVSQFLDLDYVSPKQYSE